MTIPLTENKLILQKSCFTFLYTTSIDTQHRRHQINSCDSYGHGMLDKRSRTEILPVLHPERDTKQSRYETNTFIIVIVL